MGIAEFPRDLYAWCRWELAGLLPALRRSAGRPRPTVELSRGGFRLLASDGTVMAEAADLAGLGDALRLLRSRVRSAPRVLDLRLQPDRHLRRSLSPLRLPRSRACAMAALDRMSETPFRPEDVVEIVAPYEEAASESAYHLVKKSHVVPTLEAVRSAGWRLGTIFIVDGGDAFAVPGRDLVAFRPRGFLQQAARSAAALAAAAAVVGTTAAAILTYRSYADAEAQLDRAIAQASKEVASLRSLLEERDRRLATVAEARGAKRAAMPVGAILEEMARAIPDTTWLTDIDLRAGTISFTGFSTAAAALIPALEASPMFRSPTFREPVVKAPDRSSERFSIAMELERPDG